MWMLLERTRFTLDGFDCDKIGVSYEAFKAQPSFCSSPFWSCLHNQLWNYREVSIQNWKVVPFFYWFFFCFFFHFLLHKSFYRLKQILFMCRSSVFCYYLFLFFSLLFLRLLTMICVSSYISTILFLLYFDLGSK